MIRLLVPAAMLIAAVFVATPAYAADSTSPILISNDGVTYAASSDLGLFADASLVVPGDTSAESIWIKNNTDETGRVRVDLYDAQATDRDLAGAMTIATQPGGSPATVLTAVDSGSCVVLSNDLLLGPGEAVQLQATMSVDAALGSDQGDAGDEGQNSSVSFRLRAILSDADVAASVFPGDACTVISEPMPTTPGAPSDPPDAVELPATGSAIEPGIGVAAGAALAAGLVLMFGRRKRVARD